MNMVQQQRANDLRSRLPGATRLGCCDLVLVNGADRYFGAGQRAWLFQPVRSKPKWFTNAGGIIKTAA